jgi:bifunctional non-homologous end joining protein LigD
MAALLVDELPTGDEWLYEAKFDGYRALALKDGARVTLLSRKGNDLTADYPSVRDAVAALKATSALLDGEIVAFDEAGRPSFQHLHHRSARPAAIRYFAFDLLHVDGKDLHREPLSSRRAMLEKMLANADVVFSAELPGSPEDVIQAVTDVGLEGVVAKRRDSPYESGKRSGAWQKFKVQLARSSSSVATSLKTATSSRSSSAITRTGSCGSLEECVPDSRPPSAPASSSVSRP